MSALPELPRSIREIDDRAARDLDRLARMSERNQPNELTAQGSHDSQLRREAPEPLRRPVPPPEPYPIAELGPILRPACEAIRRVIQAPDAVCGGALLAAASLAVQALVNVEIDGRAIPLTLWLVSIAESGERKSACDAEGMRPAREHEKR
ncbi:MAG: DUF3987 domain-containing protein [Xanthomonadales bacterium]|nr:DUF3987 domain-containing protein [Xanthomonadales bacterium]